MPGSEEATSDSHDLQFYSGVIPEPAPLVASGMADVPAIPEPPTDLNDREAWAEFERAIAEYTEAMQDNLGGDSMEFAKQVAQLATATRAGDEAAVAAWQSLLVASGVSVGYGDRAVEVSGMTGGGVPMTIAELRLQTLAGGLDARIPLTELANIIEGIEGFAAGSVAQPLYDDLVASGGSDFGVVFYSLADEGFGRVLQTASESGALDEITLTIGQATLALRRLSVDLLTAADAAAGIGPMASNVGPQPSSDHYSTASLASLTTSGLAAGGGACDLEETPWEQENRKNVGKALGIVFSKVVKLSGVADVLYSAASVGSAIGSLMAHMYLLQADFSMRNSPLVRTKNRAPGEVRDIKVTLSFDDDLMQETRKCLSLLLAPFGIDIQEQQESAAEGIDVSLFPTGDRLQYDSGSGTEVYRQKADSQGVVYFSVAGKPQKDRIPEGAEPDEVTSGVRIDANVSGADLVKDLISAGFDALGGPISVAISSLGRMQLVSFTWDVPVRDWTMVAEFDVTLAATLHGHHAINMSGTSEAPCGSWSINNSTTASGTVASTDPVRVQVSIVNDGPVQGTVIHTLGVEPANIPMGSNGAELAYLPAMYSVAKQKQEPGTDPMPPHYAEPGVGGCGDGDGSGFPSPDCGSRDYLSLVTMNLHDGVIKLTNDDAIDRKWNYCGSPMYPSEPLAVPRSLDSCELPRASGGESPNPDAVFGGQDSFEITGAFDCSRSSNGSLSEYQLDWTLTFCRIVEGEPAC